MFYLREKYLRRTHLHWLLCSKIIRSYALPISNRLSYTQRYFGCMEMQKAKA